MIFVRTPKGEDEVLSRTRDLAGDDKRTLPMVDGKATVGEIRKRVAPSLRDNLVDTLEYLEKNGYIHDKDKKPVASTPLKVPPHLKTATPPKQQEIEDDGGELDFMSGFTASTPQTAEAEKNLDRAEAEAEKLKQEAEAAKLKAEAEAKKIKEEAQAAKLKAEAEAKRVKELAEAEAAALIESKQAIEAERSKAKKEAEAILLKAAQEAQKLRDELEATRLKAEQEAKIQLAAAAKVREQAEAARIQAEQEAERMRAELEAIRRKVEEEARLKAEAEARHKAEEEARLKAEAEAKHKAEEEARLQAEAEARHKAEEEARLQAEAEAKHKAEEEARLKAEAEARHKAEEEARLKAEVEARHKAEEEARLQAEAEARHKAEEEARLKAEVEARHKVEVEARIKAEEEARMKAEADAKRKAEIEAEMRAELEASKIKAELEAKARLDAEARAHARMKAEDEAKIKAEQEAKQKAEEEARLKAEEEAVKQARQEASRKPHTDQASPDIKSDAFAFGSFEIDEPQTKTSTDKVSESSEIPTLDSFKIDDTPPPTQTQSSKESADVADKAKSSSAQKPEIEPASNQPVPPPPDEKKPDQNALKEAEQARLAVEKHKAEEAQAKKLADEQAKAWAEAEQRAVESAKAKAETAHHQPEHPVSGKATAAPAKAKESKPFPWGKLTGLLIKLGIVLLVLLVGAMFAAPYLLPMRDYMPKVEKLMSERLSQPVHIGYLSGQILPSPSIEIGEIYIGEGKQFQAAKAKLNFSYASLMEDIRPIDSIEIDNFKVSGTAIKDVSAWFQKLAASDQYPIGRIKFNQGTLDADVFELTGIEGDLNFNSAKNFTSANLRANSGKYTLSMDAKPDEKLQVAISVRGSALPLLPNWVFDEINAKGELSKDELVISEIDGRMLGGVIQGNSRISWHTGWQAQGKLSAKTLSLNQFNSLLEGNADGDASFKMRSSNLGGLTDSATLQGDFTTGKGTLNGMDIVETARLHSKEHLPGGRTYFDEMTGSVSFDANAYHFSKVRIKTDVLNSTSSLVIENGKLSGNINAKISIKGETAPVDLEISGTLDRPQLRTAR